MDKTIAEINLKLVNIDDKLNKLLKRSKKIKHKNTPIVNVINTEAIVSDEIENKIENDIENEIENEEMSNSDEESSIGEKYEPDETVYPSLKDTIKSPVNPAVKKIIKYSNIVAVKTNTEEQPEKIRKYIQTLVIPKYSSNIKRCKYGDSCWNIICICSHNDKQEEYYNDFFKNNRIH